MLWKCFPRCWEMHRLVARWRRHLAAWLSKPLVWVYFYFFLSCLLGLCYTSCLLPVSHVAGTSLPSAYQTDDQHLVSGSKKVGVV